MTVAVVLRRGEGDGVLQPAFLEVLGHLRRVELRLIARLCERENALDRDANRPHRHDQQHEGHGLGHPCHLLIHLHEIHGPLLLKDRKVSKYEIGSRKSKVGSRKSERYCNVKLTVTVMMTGTGTP